MERTVNLMKLCLILGDQLSEDLSSLQSLNPGDEILMAEVNAEASYVQHHPQKIALIFSGMRHFAKQLRNLGHTVHYIKLTDPQNQGDLLGQMKHLSEQLQVQQWVITEPGEWRLKKIFKEAAHNTDLDISLLEDTRFVVSHQEFQDFLNA